MNYDNSPDIISGKWYNKNTGKVITVRNSFMDGEDFQIITTDGDIITGEEFSNYYIQCADTIYNENGESTGNKEEIDYENLFISNTATPINNVESKPEVKNTIENNLSNIVEIKQETTTDNLKKIFEKFDSLPLVKLDITWENKNVSELLVLMKYLDISIDDITDYLYYKIINDEDIKNEIKSNIQNLLT